jgi:hypothetical protein
MLLIGVIVSKGFSAGISDALTWRIKLIVCEFRNNLVPVRNGRPDRRALRDALTAYLDAISRFHNYSFGNILRLSS